MHTRVLGFITFLVLSLDSPAALLLSDDFSGSSGTLKGTGGGTGWNGALWYNNSIGSPNVTYGTPGTSYSGLLSTGNKAVAGGGDSGVFRYMGATRGTGTETYWLSFVIQATANAGSSYGGVSLFTGDNNERIFIGQRSGQSVFGVEQTGTAKAGNSSVASSGLSFLVVRLDFTPSSGETLRFWVNPSLSGTPSDASAAVTLTGLSTFSFDTIRIQSGSSTVFNVDELRFGTTFGDVAPIPEPIQVGLVGFAAVMGVGKLWQRRLNPKT